MNWNQWWKVKLNKSHPEELFDPLEIRYYSMLEDVVLIEVGGLTGKKAIETGCGSGMLSFRLVKKGAHAYLIDESDLALRYAKKIGKMSKLAAFYTKAKAESLPFKTNYFDIYHSMGLVEHFEEKKILEILEEAKRVIVPGGKVFIGVPNILNPEFLKDWLFGDGDEIIIRPKKLQKLMYLTGFKNVHIEYVPEVIFWRGFFKNKLGLRILNYSSKIEKKLKKMGFLFVAIGEK